MLHQREEVDALVFGQPEGVADALEHLVRHAHVAALLEPGVPGDAHARERGDVFAAQAFGALALGHAAAQGRRA